MRWTFFLLAFFVVLGGVHANAFRPDPTPAEMADFDKEVAADPHNIKLLCDRGISYAILGQKEKAIADYQAAQKFALPHEQRRVLWGYGWALLDLDDPQAAVEVWESVAAAEREHREIGTRWIFYTLALGYWSEGDKPRAFEFYTQAAKLDMKLQDRDTFEAFTDQWTKKEQDRGLQLFDAWQKEVERPGSHLW